MVVLPMERQAREGQTGMHSRRMKRNSQRHAARRRRGVSRKAQERHKRGRDRPQAKRRSTAKASRGISHRHRRAHTHTHTHTHIRWKKRRGDLTPMTPAAEGMSFSTGFIRMTALPSLSASSTCHNTLVSHIHLESVVAKSGHQIYTLHLICTSQLQTKSNSGNTDLAVIHPLMLQY